MAKKQYFCAFFQNYNEKKSIIHISNSSVRLQIGAQSC